MLTRFISRLLLFAFPKRFRDRIGSPLVGMPAESGFGVNTDVIAPNGATL